MSDALRISLVGVMTLVIAGVGLVGNRCKLGAHWRAAFSLLPVAAIVGADWVSSPWAPGFRLMAICWLLILAMKAWVIFEERLRGRAPLSFAAWVTSTFVWVGMVPQQFSGFLGRRYEVVAAFVRRGILSLMLGGAVWWLARTSAAEGWPIHLTSALTLLAFVLTVHFGVIEILVALLRRLGAEVGSIMRNPAAAKSLSDFWGNRWNLPLTDMLRRTVLKPLRHIVGKRGLVVGSFVVSGVLHDVAISLPVGAGFGLPTLYFLIHGLLVSFERSLERKGIAVAGTWYWRVWTWAWIVVPLPLLVHESFIRGVILPLLESL